MSSYSILVSRTGRITGGFTNPNLIQYLKTVDSPYAGDFFRRAAKVVYEASGKHADNRLTIISDVLRMQQDPVVNPLYDELLFWIDLIFEKPDPIERILWLSEQTQDRQQLAKTILSQSSGVQG